MVKIKTIPRISLIAFSLIIISILFSTPYFLSSLDAAFTGISWYNRLASTYEVFFIYSSIGIPIALFLSILSIYFSNKYGNTRYLIISIFILLLGIASLGYFILTLYYLFLDMWR